MAFSSILSGVYLFPNSPVLPSFPTPQLKPPLPHLSYFQNSLWRWTFLCCIFYLTLRSHAAHQCDYEHPRPRVRWWPCSHTPCRWLWPTVCHWWGCWLGSNVVSCFRLWFASNFVAVSLFPRLYIHSCVHFCLLNISTSVQVYSFYDPYISA